MNNKIQKIKDFIIKYKFNIILYLISLVMFVGSSFVQYGIWQKLIPLLIFLTILGLASSINMNGYRFLTSAKKGLHIFLMIFVCYTEYSLITSASKGNIEITASAFIILLFFILTFWSIFFCNIVCALIYKIWTHEKIHPFHKNILYWIIFIIFIILNVLFLLGLFI